MIYLFTGLTGEVGRFLNQKLLSSGFKVAALHFERVEFDEPIRLVHLASKRPGASSAEMMAANVQFLEKTLDWFESVVSPKKDMLFFSSNSVYENLQGHEIVENQDLRPTSLYATTKLQGEKLVQDRVESGFCLRVPGVLENTRPSTFLARSAIQILNNEVITVSNEGERYNNYIGLNDLFRFIIQVESKAQVEVLNIGPSPSWTLIEILNRLGQAMGKKALIEVTDSRRPFLSTSVDKLKYGYQFSCDESLDIFDHWVKESQFLLGRGEKS